MSAWSEKQPYRPNKANTISQLAAVLAYILDGQKLRLLEREFVALSLFLEKGGLLKNMLLRLRKEFLVHIKEPPTKLHLPFSERPCIVNGFLFNLKFFEGRPFYR
jgi:hypothetical protein